jgi:hypothetical protein
MPRERSNRFNEVVEAISILKAAEKEWPRGVSNKLIKEAMESKEKELHEELFILMTQKKGRKPAKGKKLSSQVEDPRP